MRALYEIKPCSLNSLLNYLLHDFLIMTIKYVNIKNKNRHLFICFVICENWDSHENSCSQTSVLTFCKRKENYVTWNKYFELFL